MYENFVGTWETVRNREVSVLERCPHGEVRLYLDYKIQLTREFYDQKVFHLTFEHNLDIQVQCSARGIFTFKGSSAGFFRTPR